jgi:hypothetical protein
MSGAANLSNRAVIGQLLAIMAGVNQWWAGLCDLVTSTQLNGEDYGFLGGVGQMRETKGSLEAGEPQVFPWFVRNRFWELVARIPNAEFRHASSDKLRQWVGEHAVSAGHHPGQLLQTLLGTAESATCYDGVAFYSASHPIVRDGAATTQSNLKSVTVVDDAAITEAEMENALLGALVQFWGLQDNTGNDINSGIKTFKVASPAAMLPFLIKACQKMNISGGSSNVIAMGEAQTMRADGFDFRLKPVLATRMSGNLFDILAEGQQFGGPFIQQTLEDQENNFLGLDSEHSQVHGHVLAKVSRAYNIGFGRYQRALRVKFAE